jgi:uncharacterized alkaline shock family protein YloU
MSDYNRPPGTTTVSPGVLMTIARMAALGVAGVKAVGQPGSSRGRGRIPGGVRLVTHDDLVSGDMYLVVKSGVNVREVCREVQQQVARALQEMAGMITSRLDVHVEDIDYEGSEA